MLTTLALGVVTTFGLLAILWGGFITLRKYKPFDAFNSREANKRMFQLTLLIYGLGIIITIYLMLN
jgi:hypothetical protein